MLNFTGADVEGELVVNRREAEARGVAGTVISIALGSNESNTLLYTETILPQDIPVYVLGEVASRPLDRQAGGRLEQPGVRGQPEIRGRAHRIAAHGR